MYMVQLEIGAVLLVEKLTEVKFKHVKHNETCQNSFNFFFPKNLPDLLGPNFKLYMILYVQAFNNTTVVPLLVDTH